MNRRGVFEEKRGKPLYLIATVVYGFLTSGREPSCKTTNLSGEVSVPKPGWRTSDKPEYGSRGESGDRR